MPNYFKTPSLPSWADPAMASVTDPWYVSLARKGAKLIGADDPASQVMGIGTPLELPTLNKELLKRAMGSAERTAAQKRAVEQGFIHDMYHGTRKDFREFDPNLTDLGIHVTSRPETASSAVNVTDKMGNIEEFASPERLLPLEKGARTMPLKVRMNKTLEMPDMSHWDSPHSWRHRLTVPGSENEAGHGMFNASTPTNNIQALRDLFDAATKLVKREEGNRTLLAENDWRPVFREIMQKHGYDSIAYPNSIEGLGEKSHMLLYPQQIRSRFAQFLPKNINKKDILGALGGVAVAGTAAGGGSNGQ